MSSYTLRLSADFQPVVCFCWRTGAELSSYLSLSYHDKLMTCQIILQMNQTWEISSLVSTVEADVRGLTRWKNLNIHLIHFLFLSVMKAAARLCVSVNGTIPRTNCLKIKRRRCPTTTQWRPLREQRVKPFRSGLLKESLLNQVSVHRDTKQEEDISQSVHLSSESLSCLTA